MAEQEEQQSAALRSFDGLGNTVLSVACFLIAVGHLYVAFDPGLLSELQRNAFHFAGFAALAALLYPMWRTASGGAAPFGLDAVIGLAVAASAIWLAFAENAIYDRGVKLSTPDWIAAAICILGAIELTRRVAGLIIPVLIILALTYVAFWGKFVGGVFSFPGLSVETVAFRSIYGDDAMFGTIARISSTYVFLFIIFGAFLLRSGAGEFVVNLARAVAGKLVGGPGIVAGIASGLIFNFLGNRYVVFRKRYISD